MSQQPPAPQEQTAPCPKCQQPISFIAPEPFCLNHVSFSQITLTHETGITCSSCGAYYVLGIASAQIEYSLTQQERPSGLVVPAMKFLKLVQGH